jgi:hypothetical protein
MRLAYPMGCTSPLPRCNGFPGNDTIRCCRCRALSSHLYSCSSSNGSRSMQPMCTGPCGLQVGTAKLGYAPQWGASGACNRNRIRVPNGRCLYAGRACQESRCRKGARHVQPAVSKAGVLSYIAPPKRSPPPCSFDSDRQWRKTHYANLSLVITS